MSIKFLRKHDNEYEYPQIYLLAFIDPSLEYLIFRFQVFWIVIFRGLSTLNHGQSRYMVLEAEMDEECKPLLSSGTLISDDPVGNSTKPRHSYVEPSETSVSGMSESFPSTVASESDPRSLITIEAGNFNGEVAVPEEVRRIRETRELNSHLKWYQKPSVGIICCLITIHSISDALFVSPILNMTLDKVCQSIQIGAMNEAQGVSISQNRDNCDPQLLQSIASDISSKSMFVTAILNTLMAGKWGELSDRFGRIHVFTCVGAIKLLTNIGQAYFVLPGTRFSKYGIITTSCLSALSGGIFALLANANSYVSDIVEPENRSVSIGRVMSTLYVTIGAGFILASLMVKFGGGSDQIPVYASLALCLLFVTLCLTVVVEPRHKDALRDSRRHHAQRRKSFHSDFQDRSASGANGLRKYYEYYMSHMLDIISPVKKLWLPKDPNSGSLVPRYMVLLLVLIDVATLASTAAMMPALVLYTTYKFGWQTEQIGYFVSLTGIAKASVLIVIVPVLVNKVHKHFKSREDAIDNVDIFFVRVAVTAVALGTLLLMLGGGYLHVIIVFAGLQSMGAAASPTIQSAILKYCDRSMTGQVFGGIALVRSASMVIIPPLILSIYSATIGTKPLAFVLVPLACSLTALASSLLLREPN